MHLNEEPRDVRGASRRELPVRVKFKVMDWNVVGVAFNPHIIRDSTQRITDCAEGLKRSPDRGVADPELKKPASRKLMTNPSRRISMEIVCCESGPESDISQLSAHLFKVVRNFCG